jgi:peptidoglycan/xylan/chitin deacetylase (PgdA/CDA1 family)
VAGAAGLWAVYTWGSHLLALRSARRGSPAARAVALTFDDGPDPGWTPRILDALRDGGARGTFFLIGERAMRWRGIARRIAEEGHELGNHTLSHRSLWIAGPRETARQVRGGHEAIEQAAGRSPRFFRPPWGMTNLALFPLLRELGTPCVFWSTQPESRRAAAPALQVERVLDRVTPGAIVDLHDADGVPGAGGRLAQALPVLIDRLRAAGYALVPLGELL